MMEEKRLGPIRFIPGANNGKYPFSHSVYLEGDGVLIDAGSQREQLAQLQDNREVKAVWLSHWHEDHFCNLDILGDIPVWVSEEDAPPLKSVESLVDGYGVEEEYKDYWRSFFINDCHFKPPAIERFLGAGEVSLNNVTVEIIEAPGHTPGHRAFFFKEPKVLFMGDYDLTKFGPWYGDVHSSIEDTIASVRSLQNIPAEIWITSHETGLFMSEPGDLWDRYLGVIAAREEKLLDLLAEPRTMDDIINACIVYRKPRKPEALFRYGERAHMEKHLQRLLNQNLVMEENGRYLKV